VFFRQFVVLVISNLAKNILDRRAIRHFLFFSSFILSSISSLSTKTGGMGEEGDAAAATAAKNK
jgi:hypothetical protein